MGLKIKKAYGFLMDLLFPPRCAACGEVVPIGRAMCPDCKDIFRHRDYKMYCISCSKEVHLCKCGGRRDGICVTPFLYGGSIRQLILAMKFEGQRGLRFPFAEAMADSVRMLEGEEIDVVCDVPLSRQRQRKRGFNQSEDLARAVAEAINRDYVTLLRKPVDNLSQHSLSATERRKNVQGVYAVAEEEKIRGRTILLCDDVMTTGSTLNECAEVLWEAGAREVYCVSASATAPDFSGKADD